MPNNLGEQEINEIFPDEFSDSENETLSLNKEPNETAEEPQLSELELEAQGMGHTSKDEWVESGKDPERWKSPHEYVSFGQIKQQMDKNQADFDKRLDGVNKLHEAQLANKIAELESEKLTAVSEADTDAYHEAQKKIDNLNESDVKPVDGKHPDIAEWEAANPWIDDSTQTVSINGVPIAKSVIANNLFSNFIALNPNADPKSALAHIDSEMAKIDAPPSNPRRGQVNSTERSAQTAKSAKKLSWGDLSPDEINSWNAFGRDMFKDKAEFLQSVKDTRA